MIMSNDRARSHSIVHDRASFLWFRIVRDCAVFSYLVINFTTISLLFGGGSVEGPQLEGTLFWQIAVLLLFGVGIVLQIGGQTPVRRLIAAAGPIAPVMIWVMLSVTWSDFPDFSIRRAVRLIIEIITAILFAAAYRDQYKLLRVIYLSFAFILILDVAFLGVPDISFTPIGYAGVHFHKNMTGIFCLLALPVFLLAVIDRRIFSLRIVSVTLLLCCSMIFAISFSKTSLALAPICMIVTICFIWTKRARSDVAIVATLIFVLTAAIGAAILISVGVDTLLIDTVGDSTLTGRDEIWQYALSRFWQSPIFGVGYGSLWNVGTYSVLQQELLRMSFIIREGHNGYIDVMTEVGMVGLLLVALYLVATIYRLWERILCADVTRINFIAIFVFFAIVLINFTETTFFRSGDDFWLYFLLVTHASILLAPHPARTKMYSRANS
jgi:exopolysaccharide production protein ExoQ